MALIRIDCIGISVSLSFVFEHPDKIKVNISKAFAERIIHVADQQNQVDKEERNNARYYKTGGELTEANKQQSDVNENG